MGVSCGAGGSGRGGQCRLGFLFKATVPVTWIRIDDILSIEDIVSTSLKTCTFWEQYLANNL